MRYRILIIAALMSAPALAQAPLTTDLRQALQVCNEHRVPRALTAPPSPAAFRELRPFMAGWEHCNDIEKELVARDSETQKELQRKDTEDLAKKLKEKSK